MLSVLGSTSGASPKGSTRAGHRTHRAPSPLECLLPSKKEVKCNRTLERRLWARLYLRCALRQLAFEGFGSQRCCARRETKLYLHSLCLFLAFLRARFFCQILRNLPKEGEEDARSEARKERAREVMQYVRGKRGTKSKHAVVYTRLPLAEWGRRDHRSTSPARRRRCKECGSVKILKNFQSRRRTNRRRDRVFRSTRPCRARSGVGS